MLYDFTCATLFPPRALNGYSRVVNLAKYLQKNWLMIKKGGCCFLPKLFGYLILTSHLLVSCSFSVPLLGVQPYKSWQIFVSPGDQKSPEQHELFSSGMVEQTHIVTDLFGLGWF